MPNRFSTKSAKITVIQTYAPASAAKCIFFKFNSLIAPNNAATLIRFHDNLSTDISSMTLRLQTFRLQTFRLQTFAPASAAKCIFFKFNSLIAPNNAATLLRFHDNLSTDISSMTLRLQTFRLQTFRLQTFRLLLYTGQ